MANYRESGWVCPKCNSFYEGAHGPDYYSAFYCCPCSGLPGHDPDDSIDTSDFSPEDKAKLVKCIWLEEVLPEDDLDE
jgi:hypothetical protein